MDFRCFVSALYQSGTYQNLFLFQLKGFASNKEKETDLLIRQKNEAVKTTERIIHETDVYERKYSKQVIYKRNFSSQLKKAFQNNRIAKFGGELL